MVKKKVTGKKKTPVKKKTSTKKTSKSKISEKEKILVENFVALQKVMTHLSVKFDNLSGQISNLLELFEISAKALASKDFSLEKETKDTKKIMEKMDTLAEQNKILARGLTLLHEKDSPSQPTPQMRQSPPTQAPIPNPQQSSQKSSMDMGEYQKSISSSGFKPLPNQSDSFGSKLRSTRNQRKVP